MKFVERKLGGDRKKKNEGEHNLFTRPVKTNCKKLFDRNGCWWNLSAKASGANL